MLNRPAGEGEAPLLEFTRVTFRYSPTLPLLLNGIDFALGPGARVGLVGDNGVGKSTMAKLALGLHTPAAGAVRLFGHPVLWRHHYPQCGYIGDPAYHDGGLGLPTELTVGVVLKSFTALWKASGQPLVHAELTEQLGLLPLRNRQIRDLSKGERQRLMAWLALAKGPRLLIADEATGGLDTTSRSLILDVVQTGAAQQGMGLLWISHHHDEVVLLTSTVYCLADGGLTRWQQSHFNWVVQTNGQSRQYRGLAPEATLQLIGGVLLDPATQDLCLRGTRCRQAEELGQ